MKTVSRFGLVGLGAVGLMAVGACNTPGQYATRDALVAPVNCTEQRLEIYFTEGRAQLTPTAMQMLQMTGQRLSGCEIRKVAVTGLSDSSGGSTVNQNLSEQRAQAVRDALSVQGWPAPVFEVTAVGAEGARAGAVNEPLRRRTEVIIEAVPRR